MNDHPNHNYYDYSNDNNNHQHYQQQPQQQQQRQYQQQQQQQYTNNNNNDISSSVLNRIIRSKFGGFVVAIVVVLIFQFQAPTLRWIDGHRDLSIKESICDLYCTFVDYVHAYWLMGYQSIGGVVGSAWIFVRHILQLIIDGITTVFWWVAGMATGQGHGYGYGSILGGGGGRFVEMPDLEPVPPPEPVLLREEAEASSTPGTMRSTATATGGRSNSCTTSSRRRRRRRRRQLEPAFLNESDYPPGWLVYHNVLGVVTKTEADQYDLKAKQKQQNPEEEQEERHHNQQGGNSCINSNENCGGSSLNQQLGKEGVDSSVMETSSTASSSNISANRGVGTSRSNNGQEDEGE